ncbi:hypothetical protein SAMN05216311_101163 [Chitinophaga sp. CF418]|nr:hypothetical protein SAMN05216311_101163 [Chitinophaga sp. CF418]
MLCICFILAVNVSVNAATPGPVCHKYVREEWSKAKDGIWNGIKDRKNYWYKLDKEAKLWWSTNGKKWAAVEDGMWADKDGHWLKISDNKLMWSADKGATWSEVPEWKWEGPKGEWYKFDKDWTVWVTGMEM